MPFHTLTAEAAEADACGTSCPGATAGASTEADGRGSLLSGFVVGRLRRRNLPNLVLQLIDDFAQVGHVLLSISGRGGTRKCELRREGLHMVLRSWAAGATRCRAYVRQLRQRRLLPSPSPSPCLFPWQHLCWLGHPVRPEALERHTRTLSKPQTTVSSHPLALTWSSDLAELVLQVGAQSRCRLCELCLGFSDKCGFLCGVCLRVRGEELGNAQQVARISDEPVCQSAQQPWPLLRSPLQSPPQAPHYAPITSRQYGFPQLQALIEIRERPHEVVCPSMSAERERNHPCPPGNHSTPTVLETRLTKRGMHVRQPQLVVLWACVRRELGKYTTAARGHARTPRE